MTTSSTTNNLVLIVPADVLVQVAKDGYLVYHYNFLYLFIIIIIFRYHFEENKFLAVKSYHMQLAIPWPSVSTVTVCLHQGTGWSLAHLTHISLKCVPKGPIDNKLALVQVMALCRTGKKPLPETMLTQSINAYMQHLGRWVNGLSIIHAEWYIIQY